MLSTSNTRPAGSILIFYLVLVLFGSFQVCGIGLKPKKTQPRLPYHLKCSRLPLPEYFSDGSRAIFNPAAVYHEDYGWVVVIRHDQVFWIDGYWNMNTQPVVVSLGHNQSVPDKLRAQEAEIWAFDNATFSNVMEFEQADKFQAEDFRQEQLLDSVFVGIARYSKTHMSDVHVS